MHQQVGRFELLTMENFNRNYLDFFNLVKTDRAGAKDPKPTRLPCAPPCMPS
jgi:hypothetical protein